MAEYALYPEDEIALDERAGYRPIAFDEPDAEGVRYPIAIPRGGSWNPGLENPVVRTREQSDAAYANRAQYAAELARAERNRFEEEQARIKDAEAIQQAIRYQGLRKYQKLVGDGASPSEAIRLSAPELYFNHPQATALATRDVASLGMPSISTVPIGDGGNEALFVGNKYRTTLRNPPVKDPIKDLEVKEANEAVTQAMRNLSNLQRQPFYLQDAAAIKEAKGLVESTRENRRNLIRGHSAPKPPPSEETPDQIRNAWKSGKISREEAVKKLNALGYK